jgi:integrase
LLDRVYSGNIAQETGNKVVNAQELQAVNEGLKRRQARVAIEVLRSGFWVRGTFVSADGSRKRQRISLKLKATDTNLIAAEDRALQVAALSRQGLDPATAAPWLATTGKSSDSPQHSATEPLTVAAAVKQLEATFWQGKVRTSAAESTWDRITCELRRLPQHGPLTIGLLLDVARQTEPGSRTRLESCKVYKRLARVAGLAGYEQLDQLRTPYEPAPRDLPDDEPLLGFVAGLRGDPKWGWALAALLAYGCRPSEVFSLTPHADLTAQCLTLKRKGRAPTWRTALCLPKQLLVELQLQAVARPLEFSTPASYDRQEAKRHTDQWGGWLARRAAGTPLEGLQLYDLRHCWAVRSIRLGLNASLAAKTLGHDLAVHSRTYHRWMTASDVAAAAALL